MTQETKKDIELQNFYVYNSSFGPKEGEEVKKILYYYPHGTDIDTQIKDVGLTEAIIKFANTFTPNENSESLHTQKARHLYFQPEKDFWMVMTVNVPYVTKTKDNISYIEYHGDDVQDSVHTAVLQKAYDMFRLFKGTFTNALIGDSEEEKVLTLKAKLEHFFSKYLLTLKLPHCDILDVMRGMQLMPLDSLSFLRVQNFVNLLEAMFPVVEYTAVLYNDQLVWTGINPSDMQIIFNYLVTTLLPAHIETELQGGSIPRNSSGFYSNTHYGHFVNGPSASAVKDGSTSHGKISKIFLKNGSVYHLVIYRALSATICLFIDGSKTLNNDLFLELNTFMGPQLTTIASEIAEKCAITASLQNSNSNSNGDAPNIKYLYFNELNLAYKSSIHRDTRKTGNISCTAEVMRLINDLHMDKKHASISSETILKTMSDYWVIGRLSNQRHFYIVIQQKNANLIDINAEVKKVCDNQLKNIFFHPA